MDVNISIHFPFPELWCSASVNNWAAVVSHSHEKEECFVAFPVSSISDGLTSSQWQFGNHRTIFWARSVHWLHRKLTFLPRIFFC